MTRQARWIKEARRDNSWKRHDIAPPERPCKSLWVPALMVAGLFGLMLYGMVQVDAKHGTPDARETWEIAE